MRELLLTVAVAGAALTSGAPSDSLYTASTGNPANLLATGTSLWFGATGLGTLVCAGQNTLLACPYGTVTAVGKYNASFTLQTKAAAIAYTVSVLDSSGPAPISTIATATFASTGTAAATIAAGATDTINIVVRIRGGTPKGTYVGWILLTDVAGAISVGIPLSITYA
jgi:hypothetical protein